MNLNSYFLLKSLNLISDCILTKEMNLPLGLTWALYYYTLTSHFIRNTCSFSQFCAHFSLRFFLVDRNVTRCWIMSSSWFEFWDVVNYLSYHSLPSAFILLWPFSLTRCFSLQTFCSLDCSFFGTILSKI